MTGPQIRHHGPGEPDEPAPAPGPDSADEGYAAEARDSGPGLARAAPVVPLATCPPFRPDTVGLGPFDNEPFDLMPVTRDTPDGHVRPGDEIARCLGEWLTGALDAAGVALGAFDRLQVHLIARDGWGPVQTVAGWIIRARHADPARSATGPDSAQGNSGPDPPGVNPPRSS